MAMIRFQPLAIPKFSPLWNQADLSMVISPPSVSTATLTSWLNQHLARRKWHYSASGTASLYQILRSFEIKAGNEVIAPAYLCPSVYEVMLSLGIRVRYCDVDPTTAQLDLNSLGNTITKKTKCVVVPSLYGRAAPVRRIKKLFPQLLVIDDAAQAFGGYDRQQPIGTGGDAGFYSIGAGKPLFGAGGSFFWTSGKKPLTFADTDLIADRLRYMEFVYNRVFVSHTQRLPLSFLGTLLLYARFGWQRLNPVYQQAASSRDRAVMWQLLRTFAQRQKQRYPYAQQLQRLWQYHQLGDLITPVSLSFAAVKFVGVCSTTAVRQQLINSLNQHRVFFSTGYQQSDRYFQQTNFPGLLSLQSRLIELPIPRHDREMAIMERAINQLVE